VGIKRARRGEKFVTLLLLFILLTAATAGVSVVLTGPDWGSLWESLLFGMLVGWTLAIFRWPAWRAALIVIFLGVLFSLLFAVGLTEKILGLFDEFFRLVDSIIATLEIKGVDLTPLSSAAQQVFTSIGVVMGRAFVWMKDLMTGQPSFDPVAAGIVWSFMVWLVAAWAGWMVEAGKNALVAVLPALLLNLSTLSYGRNDSASIYLILGVTLVLIAVVQYDHREQAWTETKVAFPARKVREVGNVSLMIAVLLVVLAAFISSLSVQRIMRWTSEIRGSSDQGQSGLAKSLGIQPAATSTPDAFSTIRSPGLPRELLVGAGPELSREQVMSVQVNDLASLLHGGQLPPLYWRSFTYDIYTGHGWNSSATEQSYYPEDQPIQPDNLPDHQLIQEIIRPVPGEGGTAYAAGEPISINVPSSAAWRSSNDLFGIQTGNNGYKIQSLIPVFDENALRKAGQDYPNWVAQRYLTVPSEVPTRVKELAIQLTATEPTAYDRARAIEQFLRQTYAYTLDVPHPPANRDLVDYFLFDLRKGYCDYYASAMVVLARAAGIPARLAIGYASGIYNLNSNRFIVTQADAHSWVEVYFPGIGWVPFEPTAGLPAINRSTQLTQEATPVSTQLGLIPKGTGTADIGKYSGLIILAGAAVLVISWGLFDEINIRRLKPQIVAREVYRRMKRYGILLNVPLAGGETPYEFANMLEWRIKEITRHKTITTAGLIAVDEAQSIIYKIVRLSYQPTDVKTAAKLEIISLWGTLRWRLRLTWLFNIWEVIIHRLKDGFDGKPEENGA
jgi:transglutaminase-like putative cysteine protease/uncharacterized membrane protein YidH (DUF202 family)